MFVLGIDPGLSRLGYGCVEHLRFGKARPVAAGVITTDPGDPIPDRLLEMRNEVAALISELEPAVVAIERVLFQVNARTTMSVGQASGVVMVEAADAGCDIIEYSPNQVKQTVTGSGSASKERVEIMVKELLGIDRPLRPVDASDALAVALCHLAHSPALRVRAVTTR